MLSWPTALAIVAVAVLGLAGWFAWLAHRPTITDAHLQKLLLLVADLQALKDQLDKGRK